MAALLLRFLGGFEALMEDEPASGFESDKARGLLAYLAVEAERPQRRETLAALLWPDLPERAARGNLRRVLANVRDVIADREAEPPFLIITRQSIQFNENAEYKLDTVDLQNAVMIGRRHSSGTSGLEAALDGYGGDFLAGFSVADSAAFEQWLLERRANFRRLALEGLELLVHRYELRGDWDAALAVSRRQLDIDALREEGYRQTMRLLSLMGDRSGALAQYEKCRALLAGELDVQPEEATTALYEQIRDGRLQYVAPAPWGEALRGYELRERIGSGAFGVVYRAYQPVVERQVAIKVIRPEFANRPDFIRRFEAEARLVARLDHLHIVPLYDYWREPDGAFLVMRWLRGGNLQQSLHDGPWPLQPVAVLLDQLAGALAYAHQRGVVHGDVRAENILLDGAGNAYLSDFGIARDQAEPLPVPQADTLSGSVMAISPEQVSGSPASPRSDQYCLALVLYQVLAGRSPLAGKTPQEQIALMESLLPPLSHIRPDLPPQLDAVLQRAFSKNPAARYPDVLSLALDFRAAAGDARENTAVLLDLQGEPVNPYKGLQPFAESDAPNFFGRDALVRQLLARLGENGRLLAVVGPSGSGKSSVVSAGLIPALRRGALPGSELWYVARMVPGERPLRELEMALRQVAASWPEEASALLLQDEAGLVKTAERLLPDENSTLLLAVDQFEELYTRAAETAETEHFLRLLAAAAEEEDNSLRVVITLRADFYDRPLLHRSFSRPLRHGTEVVLPMTREELLEAVRCPAERAGVRFAPGVAEGIVEEVYEQPGTLPILQYALTELFKEQSDRLITRRAYEAIGGVAGALALRAEEVYTSLAGEEQDVARHVFLRLVSLGEGGEGASAPDTRRRVLQRELQNLAGGETAVAPVLRAFGACRLLTFDRDQETRSPTVEIAHEALLTEWPRLAGWLEENRDDLRLQRRLTAAAGEWIAAGRDPGLLAGETRLAQYKTLAAETMLALTMDEQAYIAASLEAEEARQAQARRTRKLLRALGLGASLAAVVTAILALFAWNARTAALREADVNHSIVLATSAEEAIGAGETDLALALALAAVNMDDPPPEAVSSLAAVAHGRGTKLLLSGHSGAARGAAFSPDDTQILSGSCLPGAAGAGCGAGELILWDAASGAELARWTGHESGVTAVAWHPDGRHAFSGGGDGSLIIWDMNDHTAVIEEPLHDGPINAIAVSPDGTLAAAAAADRAISLIDTSSGAVVKRLTGHEAAVRDVAFSPDSRQLVSGGEDALVILWDAAGGKELYRFAGHTLGISGVAFMDDGAAILSGSYDQTVRKWDIAGGAQVELRESGDTVDGLALSPDGHHVLHNSLSIIYAWDTAQFNGPHEKMVGGELLNELYDLAFSSDGRYALAASEDGTVRVWDLGAGDIRQTNLGFPAVSVAVSPDAALLAIASWGPDLALWDVNTNTLGQMLSLPPAYSYTPGSIAFSAGGRYLAGGAGEQFQDSNEGAVTVWEMDSREPLCEFREHTKPPRTVAFSPTDLTILSGSMSDGGDLFYWDAATCTPIHHLPTDEEISGVAISADGHYGLSSSNLGRATLWDLQTGEALRYFEMPGDYLLDTTFGPQDKTILAGGVSGNIVQWDRETGQEIRRFPGHDGGVFALEVSDDGRWLASSDDAGLVILWDLASGTAVRQHNAHNAQVFHLAFSPDSQTLYSVSIDETLVAWHIGDPSLAGTLAWIDDNRYLRELTCDERARFGVEPLCE